MVPSEAHSTANMAPFVEEPSDKESITEFAPWSVEGLLEQLNIDEKVSLLAGMFDLLSLRDFLD